jgi:hypothetical protein
MFPLNLSLSHWEVWAVPLVGLTSAGLTLLVCRTFLRPSNQGLPKPKACKPQLDPFDYGSATERRSSLRRSGKMIKVLISDAEATATPVKGWVMDRSMGGLGLSVQKPVPENTILSVRTVDAPENTPWVQVKVKRCTADEERWEIGCQYVRTPSWSILLLFG